MVTRGMAKSKAGLRTRKLRQAAGGELPPGGGDDPFYLSGANNIRYSIMDIIHKLVDTALVIDDAEEAREHLAKIVRSSFLARFGGPLAALIAKRDLTQSELTVAANELLRLRDRQTHTLQWLQTAGVNHDRDLGTKTEVVFRDWQFRHRVEVPILVVLLIVAFTASYVTAYGNLVGTGASIFIETPVAYFMAAMAPLAGFALKMFGNVFRTDRGHRRFTITLFSAAVMLAFTWAGLFAVLYHGLSTDGLGGDLFAEPTFWDEIKNTLFTGVTLGTEITLGAALASRLDRLARVYSPDHWYRNPEYDELSSAIEAQRSLVETRTDQIAELNSDLALYEHNLDLQMAMAGLALSSRRARLANSDFI